MSVSRVIGPGGYRPGNRVRVVLGKAAGLPGRVLSFLQAQALSQKSGLPFVGFQHSPGQVCVAVTILGVIIPMSRDLAQIKLDPLA
jgi:hypothetical protein